MPVPWASLSTYTRMTVTVPPNPIRTMRWSIRPCRTSPARTPFAVRPGDFFLEFVDPNERSFTAANLGQDDSVDSDVNPESGLTQVFTFAFGTEEDVSWDAGLIPARGILGDRVFVDLDVNGLQGPADPGAGGVTVNLYEDDGDGIAEPNEGDALIDSTFTTENGNYEFSVFPGDYFLEFVDSLTRSFTSANTGNDDSLDSDVNEQTGLTDVFPFAFGTSSDTGRERGPDPSRGDFRGPCLCRRRPRRPSGRR